MVELSLISLVHIDKKCNFLFLSACSRFHIGFAIINFAKAHILHNTLIGLYNYSFRFNILHLDRYKI